MSSDHKETTEYAQPVVYYSDDAVTLYHGDSRGFLPTLADQSVDCVITDPPYDDRETDAIRCRFCPPGCKSCEPDDCECYTHQDWPDTTLSEAMAGRLSACLDLPGCDGISHQIECNNAYFGGSRG